MPIENPVRIANPKIKMADRAVTQERRAINDSAASAAGIQTSELAGIFHTAIAPRITHHPKAKTTSERVTNRFR